MTIESRKWHSGQDLRLVFFYSRIPPYLTAVLDALIRTGRVGMVDVVHWDQGSSNGNEYKPVPIDRVSYVPRSQLDEAGLYRLLDSKAPHIVYVPGWMDKGYLRALERYRSSASTVVVAGIDDQWWGSLRQRTGALYYRFAYRRTIDAMWVAGGPQRVYASRFGYEGKDVIPYLLSADVGRLSQAASGDRKRFLFLGRFDPVKGLDLLIQAYKMLPGRIKDDWALELVGDGVLRDSLLSDSIGENIVFHPYVQPGDLVPLLSGGGVACFPSRHEQWGVAIHELSAAGYPLILSDACGAGSEFLVDGYNGFSCRTGDATSLSRAMQRMAELTMTERERFSGRSRRLAERITPDLSAAALLSLFN